MSERLADDAVQRNQDGEGDEGPEAARHGVDLLLLIELCDLGLVFLLVAAVLLLQLLDYRREAGHAHHAALALELEGQHDKSHDQGEQDNREAEVLHRLIELEQQPGKRHCDYGHLLSPISPRGSGHGVVEIVVLVSVKGMTADNTPEGQPRALGGAVFLERLEGVLRAGGHEAAAGREHRRYGGTIKVNRQQQYAGQKAFHSRASNLEQTLSKSDDNLFCTNPNSATSFPIYIKAISSPRPLTAETSFRLFNR